MTDAELDLAVAKAMGKDVELVSKAASSRGRRNVCVHMILVSGVRIPTWEWSPTSGGADAWEVLIWFLEHADSAEAREGFNDLWFLKAEAVPAALCHAVVALGGDE